jgi:phytoene desaturase
MPEKVAVIGAGIAGIAVAVRLASKGYLVEVFEKNAGPGGKMSEIRHKGFRFDAGPSLFTLPELIRELYDVAGEKMDGQLDYLKLETVCRYYYEDGMVINGFGDPGAFAEELGRQAREDGLKVRRYLEKSRYIYDFTYPVFIRRSLHEIRNYLRPEFLNAFFKLPYLKPFKTLHQLNRKFFRHPNTVKLFDRFATYNGSSPFRAPATLMVIPHLEHNIGAFFPKSGMHQVARSLVNLAEKLGVVFHYGVEVKEILVGNKREGILHGLRTSNHEPGTGFNHIITDLDVYYVYKNLLKDIPFPEHWFRHERSTSALIFYWGMNISTDRLDVHNILFANNYREEFEFLFDKKSIQPDPTVYIFISSKIVPDDAPEGCENWFVMVNVPPDEGQDWESGIEDMRNKIEGKIGRMLGIPVKDHRLFEFVLDPKGIASRTASYRGSLYGNSSNSMFAAFQRPSNFSRIRGIYHVGGSVHPGGGIPLCLSSAKIVADHIQSLHTRP